MHFLNNQHKILPGTLSFQMHIVMPGLDLKGVQIHYGFQPQDLCYPIRFSLIVSWLIMMHGCES